MITRGTGSAVNDGELPCVAREFFPTLGFFTRAFPFDDGTRRTIPRDWNEQGLGPASWRNDSKADRDFENFEFIFGKPKFRTAPVAKNLWDDQVPWRIRQVCLILVVGGDVVQTAVRSTI